jgi:hypothetical protein
VVQRRIELRCFTFQQKLSAGSSSLPVPCGPSAWLSGMGCTLSLLLHIGFDGVVRTMMSNQNADLEWAIPSPDGRHLAIVKDSNSSNVWLLENL